MTGTQVSHASDEPWWMTAVVYQIYPRSFASSQAAPIGDLAGIRQRLGHLAWLGIDALWLSPFFPSPMADGGYDIADYCAVDPRFGTLADFDRLLADAHSFGIRVLIDWVPNHTSERHPWFVDARRSRTSAKRNRYIWRDVPNNWRAAFNAGSAWSFDAATEQYYLHLFLPQQPDLNWRNEDVVAAMHGVLEFWLDRGVDGFRIDAVHCIGKDPTFADDARCVGGAPLSDFNDQPFTHDVLRGVRALVDTYPGERVIVGEVNLPDTAAIVRYYGAGDELQLSFNFRLLHAPWDALAFRSIIAEVDTQMRAASASPTWVLSNHDNDRHRTRYGGSLRRARAAAVLLLTLRGTPFLFQGEELGLEDVVLPTDARVDPGGRDGPRGPIPWTTRFPHGWPGGHTSLPFPPDASELSAESQRADASSTLHLYRRLIAVRHASRALSLGAFMFLESPRDTLAFRRSADGDERVVLVNFANRPNVIPVLGDWEIDVASDGPAGRPYEGSVEAETAMVLRREATTEVNSLH